jgi:DNA-binding CsgD family transcriptional regulator
MSTEAWNKIEQTHDLFRKIIEPLKQHLGINFGYMIVFKDGSYYKIIEDLECLKKWVTNVETSHIFCARNVTTYFDDPYNFTIWPEEPTCLAMEIYKKYGMWNGITVSRPNKDYTELYWFTKENAEDGWHKFFIRSKISLLEFIKHFDSYKKEFHITPSNIANSNLFQYSQSFGFNIPQSEYIQSELPILKEFSKLLRIDKLNNKCQTKAHLTKREIEVLSIIGQGYTLKTVARDLQISIKTAQYYLDQIKLKTGLHFKSEFIKFYQELAH